LRPAEQLLVELGVCAPKEIDLLAIADCVGAQVLYRRLVGCEAQIIGFKDRAIIYVSDAARPNRKRFSTGHELGHWHHHRGQSFVCRSQDIGRPLDERSRNAERMADVYSADLILPPYLIKPKLQVAGEVSLDEIVSLAHDFSASLTATGIRIMRMTREPLILIVQDLAGTKWQWPGIAVGGLKVRNDIDLRSSVTLSLAGVNRVGPAKKEPASYWFDRRHVEQFDVRVQSVRTIEGEALTLLRIMDPRMIEIYG
jgi:IrrE N-terminal-like domain